MISNLVLVHGGGMGAWVWDETVAALDDRVRCLAVDAPGCGTKRGHDTSSLDVDDIADELVREIVAAGMKHVVLVGHSQAEVMNTHPQLLAGALLSACRA